MGTGDGAASFSAITISHSTTALRTMWPKTTKLFTMYLLSLLHGNRCDGSQNRAGEGTKTYPFLENVWPRKGDKVIIQPNLHARYHVTSATE